MKRTFRQPAMLSAHCVAWLVAFICCCAVAERRAAAQELDREPPPLKQLALEDRQQLSTARDMRDRIRISVRLCDERLRRAADFTAQQNFDAAAGELGKYEGLIEETVRYLQQSVRDKHARDNFKQFELALRSHAPRLETIRRDSPSEYALNIKSVYEFSRNARSESLNAFYGQTVLTEAPAIAAPQMDVRSSFDGAHQSAAQRPPVNQ